MKDVRHFPELVKGDPHAPLLANLDPEHGTLGASPVHSVPHDHLEHSVRVFIEFLQNSSESDYGSDYGDFMRQANASLESLKEQFSVSDPRKLEMLEKMQMYTQFCPVWDFEPTQIQLLQDAQKLLK